MADPHISNFGVTLPQLEELDKQDMADLFPTTMPFPVTSRHGRVPLANLPAYTVARESLACMLEEQKLFPGERKFQIRILGFGKGTLILFGRRSHDAERFHAGCDASTRTFDARRIETLTLLGLVRYRTNREGIWVRFAVDRRWDYKDDKVQVFFDLLKKMMATNPEKRISIQEAMAYPFLLYEEFLRPRRVDETNRRNKPAVSADNPIIDRGKSPATEVWETRNNTSSLAWK
ncbi:hypothetical protein MY4824_005763 [Beauveria thailandica]